MGIQGLRGKLRNMSRVARHKDQRLEVDTEGVDVFPGGHEIQDWKRRGRIGYKRAV